MIEEHTICSPSTGYCRKIWYLPSALESPEKVGVFLDGEYYVDRMDAPTMIRGLETSGELPPMSYIFVSYLDGAARHIDLTCNPRYMQFIVEDILPWIRERNPNLAEGGHLIGGTSLSGLAAAHTTLNHPDIFSRCLAHSGSFWWNREWLSTQLESPRLAVDKWWISVGDKEIEPNATHQPSGMIQEVTQVSACKRFATALERMNQNVNFRIYEGGHEIAPWAAELPDALQWLMQQNEETEQVGDGDAEEAV